MKAHFYICNRCGQREQPESAADMPGPWCGCARSRPPRKYEGGLTCPRCDGPREAGYRFCPSCYREHKRGQREALTPPPLAA
jgi:hypothetical protein